MRAKEFIGEVYGDDYETISSVGTDFIVEQMVDFAEKYHERLVTLGLPSVSCCSCDKPEKITTVHPLPDVCGYCRKAIKEQHTNGEAKKRTLRMFFDECQKAFFNALLFGEKPAHQKQIIKEKRVNQLNKNPRKMKNKYDEIRPVMSVTDIRDLVESKGLIMVKGWKKPVSASFIGVMPEHTIEKYAEEGRMHVVVKKITTDEAIEIVKEMNKRPLEVVIESAEVKESYEEGKPSPWQRIKSYFSWWRASN